jgi:hypothetical protein
MFVSYLIISTMLSAIPAWARCRSSRLSIRYGTTSKHAIRHTGNPDAKPVTPNSILGKSHAKMVRRADATSGVLSGDVVGMGVMER